jgi:hypothetical protein
VKSKDEEAEKHKGGRGTKTCVKENEAEGGDGSEGVGERIKSKELEIEKVLLTGEVGANC